MSSNTVADAASSATLPQLSIDSSSSADACSAVNDNNKVAQSNDEAAATRHLATSPAFRAARMGFFFQFLALGVFAPFASVLFAAKKFSPAATGLLMATNPIATLIVVPPMCYLAETRGWQVPMMYAGLIAGSLLMSFICVADDQLQVAVATTVHYISTNHLFPLYDEHVMSVLGPAHKADWGSLRVWGAYAWALAAPLGSLIFGHLGWQYLPIVIVFGNAGFAYCIHRTPVVKVAGSHRYADVFRHILRHPRIINFMCGIACMGMGYAVIGTYLFIFLQQDLLAPPILLGLCVVFTVLIEIPLFRASKALHRTFSDAVMFMFAVGGFVVRVLGYSLLTNPWLVLPLEMFHGLTFAMMWLSGINFFSAAFPPELANSAIGFLHACAFGVGPIVGNIVGGHLYEWCGPRQMFRIFAAALAVVGCVFWFVDRALARRASPPAVTGDENSAASSSPAGVVADAVAAVDAAVVDTAARRHTEVDLELAQASVLPL